MRESWKAGERGGGVFFPIFGGNTDQDPDRDLDESPGQSDGALPVPQYPNATLIERHGEAAGRLGTGKTLVQRWKAAKTDYQRIFME